MVEPYRLCYFLFMAFIMESDRFYSFICTNSVGSVLSSEMISIHSSIAATASPNSKSYCSKSSFCAALSSCSLWISVAYPSIKFCALEISFLVVSSSALDVAIRFVLYSMAWSASVTA